MPVKVTDDEFISCWKRLCSPVAVARALGCSERNVHKRRVTIEGKYNIKLESITVGSQGRPKVPVLQNGQRAIHESVRGFVMIGSDGHFWPGDRSAAFDAFIKLIPQLNPSMIIMGGDSFDGARVSRHAPLNWSSLPDVADELAAVQERHAEIESLAPPGCPLIWAMGNHDARFSARLAQQAPDYVRVKGFDLPDHFQSWQFCMSIHLNGHTVVKHRMYQSQHAPFQNTLKSGRNIVTGHTHRLQSAMFSDYDGVRWGIECGTLGVWGPGTDKGAYTEDNPSNTSEGFAVLSFADNGMLLEPEFCRVLNGQAYFRGQRV